MSAGPAKLTHCLGSSVCRVRAPAVCCAFSVGKAGCLIAIEPYLNASLLIICLRAVQAHAPHDFEAVLHQCLDELELVKVQQLHQFILHGSISCRALHHKESTSPADSRWARRGETMRQVKQAAGFAKGSPAGDAAQGP